MGYSSGLIPAKIVPLSPETGYPNAEAAILGLLQRQGVSNNLNFAQEQSSNFTAEVSYSYPVDTSDRNVTVIPPNNAVSGDRFAVFDSRGTAAVNNITIDFVATSALFHGSNQNYALNQETAYAEFILIDENIGWIVRK